MEKYIIEYKKLLNKNIKLNEEEKQILDFYKTYGFTDINNLLRNIPNNIILDYLSKSYKNKSILEILNIYYENIIDKIKKLDKIIVKSVIIPKNFEVYRGIRLNPCDKNYYKLNNMLLSLENNKHIIVNDFLSTSLNINVAKNFTYYQSNKNNENIKYLYVLFKINFPKKTYCLPLTWNTNNLKSEIVQSSEVELLLPRGGELLFKNKKIKKLDVPVYKWKNINKNIPKEDFIIYEVDYIPRKNNSLPSFDEFKQNTKIELRSHDFKNFICIK